MGEAKGRGRRRQRERERPMFGNVLQSFKVLSFFELYQYLLSCRIILGFARLGGNGLRGRQTPMGDRCQAGVWACACVCESVCVFENVCVSVSNGAINWPARSIMRVPGLAPLGLLHTCTNAHLNERTHTQIHTHPPPTHICT